MALESQIDAAARPDSRPAAITYGGDMHSGSLLNLARADELAEALERDLGRLFVRRLANRHGCDGLCDRPEHARDVAAGRAVAEALGLLYPEGGDAR